MFGVGIVFFVSNHPNKIHKDIVFNSYLFPSCDQNRVGFRESFYNFLRKYIYQFQNFFTI